MAANNKKGGEDKWSVYILKDAERIESAMPL